MNAPDSSHEHFHHLLHFLSSVEDVVAGGSATSTLLRLIHIVNQKRCTAVLYSILFYYYIYSLDIPIFIMYSTAIASLHDSLAAGL
jgi:hypothetical protein